MPKINILDRETAELIAAGEVIERPASVVKELVENSIDAGSTAITVEIGHGGVRLIRVTDNGCGIEREDVPKAFLRHATSKVLRPEDLDRIGTLGFRGEALASICAVSETEILTRAATCWRPFLRCMAMNLAGDSSRWSVRTGLSGSAATWQGRNAAGPPAAWSTFSSTIAM